MSSPASENGPKEAMNKSQKKDDKKHGKSRKAELLHLHMQMLEQVHRNTGSLPKLWASQTLSSITSSSASPGGLLTWANKLSAITFQVLHVAVFPLLPEDSAYHGILCWGHQSLYQLSIACNCSWLSCTNQLHYKLMSKWKLLHHKNNYLYNVLVILCRSLAVSIALLWHRSLCWPKFLPPPKSVAFSLTSVAWNKTLNLGKGSVVQKYLSPG